MAEMQSFTIYKEYYDLITLLSTKEQQELLLAIVEYMFEDKEPLLNDRQIKIFNNLKRPLDKSKEQSKRRTNQKPNENQIETKQEPKGQPKENTSNDVYVNVNYLESNKGVIGEKEKTFRKPKIEEIQRYCNERNNGINAEAFYDFYESKDWYVGKNKMKDWKACVRTWEKRNAKSEPIWFGKTSTKKQVTKEEKEELETLLKEFKEEENEI